MKPACMAVRNDKNMLIRQIDDYKGDPRAVFVYTFTRDNIDQVREVAEILTTRGCRLTFNMFSAPVGYEMAPCVTRRRLLSIPAKP